eukprot:6205676-Pleurochrysis_carterae.AAC.1
MSDQRPGRRGLMPGDLGMPRILMIQNVQNSRERLYQPTCPQTNLISGVSTDSPTCMSPVLHCKAICSVLVRDAPAKIITCHTSSLLYVNQLKAESGQQSYPCSTS